MTALAFRPADEADASFILDTFLRSFRGSHTAGLIQMDDWWAVMGPQFQKLLLRPGVEVTMAYKPGEGAGCDLYGWLAVERGHPRPLVLYVYVKHAYRTMGIARRLLGAAGIDPEQPFDYAAKTAVVSRLSSKIPRARWQPLAARYPKKQTPEGAR